MVGRYYSVETDYSRISLFKKVGSDVQVKVTPAETERDLDIIGKVAMKFEWGLLEVLVGDFVVEEDRSIRVSEHALSLTLEASDTQLKGLNVGDYVSFRLHGLRLFDQGY